MSVAGNGNETATAGVSGPTAGVALRTGAADGRFTVVGSRRIYRGRVLGLRVDELRMPDGSVAVREVVEHPGAVAVVALDDVGRVIVIRQYRHSAGVYLTELPAGLLDVAGEPAQQTARRELFEEAGLRAGRWHTLLDLRSSPGMTEEALRVFLARDLSPVPVAERYATVAEEADLQVHAVDLDEAARAVLAGEIENAVAVAGILAAARARDQGWAPLRPPDAFWPARPDR